MERKLKDEIRAYAAEHGEDDALMAYAWFGRDTVRGVLGLSTMTDEVKKVKKIDIESVDMTDITGEVKSMRQLWKDELVLYCHEYLGSGVLMDFIMGKGFTVKDIANGIGVPLSILHHYRRLYRMLPTLRSGGNKLKVDACVKELRQLSVTIAQIADKHYHLCLQGKIKC